MVRRGEKTFITIFLAPPLLIYLVFFVIPFFDLFRTSFYKWSGLTADMTFVGLQNFKQLLQDPVVVKAIYNNLYLLFFSSIIIFIIAMFFAVIFTTKKYPEIPLYKVLFFFPNTLSIIIVAILWMFIYNPSFGIISGLLELIGVTDSPEFLASSDTVMPALVFPLVWMLIGFYMVLFIASINTISPSLYEAAEIDGAGLFQQFIHITLPSIWYTIQITSVFFIITTVNNSFALITVATGGGPNQASEVITTYFYNQAFEFSNFGYGAAIGMTIFVFMFVLSLIVLRITRRDNTL